MKAIQKIITLMLVAILIATSSFAQQKPNHPKHGNQQHKNEFMVPGLTESQKEQIDKIHLTALKKMQPIKNTIAEKKARLRSLATATNADIKSINKQIDDIADLEASLEKIKVGSHQKIRNILTEEQRIVFDARSQKRFSENCMGKNKSKMGKLNGQP